MPHCSVIDAQTLGPTLCPVRRSSRLACQSTILRGRSEGHKGSSRSRRRTRWPNLLTAAIAYSAVKFTGAHVIGSNSDPQGGRPDEPASQPSCEATKQQPQVIFQATEAHTLVQLSDRGDCLFRIETHRRSCDSVVQIIAFPF